MKIDRNILSASLGVLVVFSNVAYTYFQTRAMEARLQTLEGRVRFAEAQVGATPAALKLNTLALPGLSPNTPTIPAAPMAYTLVPSSKRGAELPTIDERVRRLEQQLAPHFSPIVQRAGE